MEPGITESQCNTQCMQMSIKPCVGNPFFFLYSIFKFQNGVVEIFEQPKMVKLLIGIGHWVKVDVLPTNNLIQCRIETRALLTIYDKQSSHRC